jgi:Flp pilus assembly protein TadG
MTGERGAVSTELAVMTPVLIGLLLFVVYAGRIVEAEAAVAHAAYEAARAATLTGTPSAAHAAAAETAVANIAVGAVSCRSLDVAVDTAAFNPGGHVTVTLTCQATFADLALLAVPGTRAFTASATAVIDVHRSTNTAAAP